MLINNLFIQFNWFNKTNLRFCSTYKFYSKAIIYFYTLSRNIPFEYYLCASLLRFKRISSQKN